MVKWIRTSRLSIRHRARGTRAHGHRKLAGTTHTATESTQVLPEPSLLSSVHQTTGYEPLERHRLRALGQTTGYEPLKWIWTSRLSITNSLSLWVTGVLAVADGEGAERGGAPARERAVHAQGERAAGGGGAGQEGARPPPPPRPGTSSSLTSNLLQGWTSSSLTSNLLLH